MCERGVSCTEYLYRVPGHCGRRFLDVKGYVDLTGGYCWRTPFKVLGSTFSRGSLLSFLAFEKACWAHQFGTWGVGQQHPGDNLTCGKSKVIGAHVSRLSPLSLEQSLNASRAPCLSSNALRYSLERRASCIFLACHRQRDNTPPRRGGAGEGCRCPNSHGRSRPIGHGFCPSSGHFL